MNKLLQVLLIVSAFMVSCQSEYRGIPASYHSLLDTALVKAGENRTELERALKTVSQKNKEATAFLISWMPEHDLKTLDSDFILDQVNGASRVREEFSWCRGLPDSIFLNEVLPYYNLDEKRDNWRYDFYSRFSPFVKNCNSIYEAVDSVNLNIKKILGVEYNTKRSAVNISPFQAIEEKMATCTGLSFLLVNAFRSVGIPARIAGTPLWTNMRGNHSWVEVWIEGQWYFTEYYPDDLNKSWFLEDAGKADPVKPIHWIYAASYKPAQTHYPLVWDEESNVIHAENVTGRYIMLYQEQLAGKELKEDEIFIDVVLYSDKNERGGQGRIAEKVTLWEENKQVDFGYTPLSTDDLNRYLKFRLKKGIIYRLEYTSDDGKTISRQVNSAEEPGNVVKLYKRMPQV